MASILRFANVVKNYNINKDQKQEVLKGISLEFDSGELVALVGESGCGKSTLINILGGLDMDYTGSVVFKGNFIRDYSEEQMDDYRKKVVGLVFQNYNLIGHMTIFENVEIAMTMSDLSKELRHERTLELLKLVGLVDYKDKLPSQLSGGQKQRVAIARAIANNPSIILADEPTGALDKESSKLVMDILKKIAETGKLVIVVTHSLQIASECSRIIHLDDGKLVSDEVNYKIKIEDKRLKIAKPRSIQKREIFKIAYKNIKQRKMRNILVSVGMAIGILSFVLILCLSDGITNYINDVYSEALQSTELMVTKKNTSAFSSTDYTNIESISGIKAYEKSTLNKTCKYSYDDLNKNIDYLSGFYDSYYPDIIYGVLPSSDGYCIVNLAFATDFDENNIKACLGETITIEASANTMNFVISGIYQDTTANSSANNVLISSNDLDTLIPNKTVNVLYLTVKNATDVSDITDELEALSFTVNQADSTVSTVVSYISLGTNVLTAVSLVSLVVASIMIFIVLYISTVERTKEIGIIRAIGGRRKDIKYLFLYEAGMLGFIAGVIGVVGTIVVESITNIVCEFTLHSMLISYNVLYYLLGLVISVVVALLAGIAPSYQAANLDPVEALRYE